MSSRGKRGSGASSAEERGKKRAKTSGKSSSSKKGPKKPSESNPDADGSSSDEGEGGTVTVAWEFVDPGEQHYHSVSGFLARYLDGTSFSIGDLSDAIVRQSTVGTVLTVQDGDPGDVFGFISVLPFALHKDATWRKEVLSYFGSTAKKAVGAGGREAAEKLAAAVNDPKRKIGLLVSERMVNVPLALSEPLSRALFDEVKWATEDEPTAERREGFKITDYLMSSRLFVEVGDDSDGQPEWSKYEDALYDQVATVSWRYPVAYASSDSKPTLDSAVQEYRQIMLVPAQAVATVRQGLEQVFGKSESEV